MNYVGSELRRALLASGSSSGGGGGGSGGSAGAAMRRRAALRDACLLHLTRKVPKLYTADWVARRALTTKAADVLQCTRNASWPPSARARAERRRTLLASLPQPLPAGKYEIGKVMCQGELPPCGLQAWVAQPPGTFAV